MQIVAKDLKAGKLPMDFSFEHLVFMGHSFGGGTAMNAVADSYAKASVTFDPWVFPFYKEEGVAAGFN
jgi:dienelactone hydrolase